MKLLNYIDFINAKATTSIHNDSIKVDTSQLNSTLRFIHSKKTLYAGLLPKDGRPYLRIVVWEKLLCSLNGAHKFVKSVVAQC